MHTVSHKFQVNDTVYLVKPLHTACPTCGRHTLFCQWAAIGPCFVQSVTISPTPYGANSPVYVLQLGAEVHQGVLEMNCFATPKEAEAEIQRRKEHAGEEGERE